MSDRRAKFLGNFIFITEYRDISRRKEEKKIRNAYCMNSIRKL